MVQDRSHPEAAAASPQMAEQEALREQLLNTPAMPVDEAVREFWNGTDGEPGLGVAMLAPLIVFDSNGDGRINANDEAPPGYSQEDMSAVDLDLQALGRGMLAAQQQVAQHFDTNGDRQFSINEFARYMEHTISRIDALEVPEREGVTTTQHVLEAYEQNVNSGLPNLRRDSQEPQR